MENKNMELWESVEKTNPKHTKTISNGGRTLTAINAQQQIKNATSIWGKYGHKWGLESIKLDYINELSDGQILAVSQAIFRYPDGAFEIGSSIFVQQFYKNKEYLNVDDDFLKKLETDMLTKALSKLGFNADVFLGYYDDNKYLASLKNEFGVNDSDGKGQQSSPTKSIERPITAKEVKEFWNGKIYNGGVVYVGKQKIKIPESQIEKLKNHEKYTKQ
jgi:hypothetical protein